MLKKTVSVLLALCAVLCLLLPAAALQQTGPIKVTLYSDIAGCTQKDVNRLITPETDNVVLKARGDMPVSVSDYAGTPEPGKLVAGRTYYVHYALTAAPGYELPQTKEELNVTAQCGKGVEVISVLRTEGHIREDDGEIHIYPGVNIYARVVVDGNVFQRFAGMIHDLILKIRAWSLY